VKVTLVYNANFRTVLDVSDLTMACPKLLVTLINVPNTAMPCPEIAA
jgi:hypothetical protein